MTLAEAIQSHGWRSNQQIAEAVRPSLPILAEWIERHPSPDSVVGIVSGLQVWAKENAVTVADISAVMAVMEEQPWAFRILLDQLAVADPFTVPTTSKIGYKELRKELTEIWPDNGVRFMDAEYSTCTVAALTDAVKRTGYRYGEWIAEEMDCDEWAGRLWGALQRARPGNLAVGFVTICGQYKSGQSGCHALLLARCESGLYWIENTGKIYALGTLPDWHNETIELDAGVI